MATVHTENVDNDKMKSETWTLGNADTGASALMRRWADRTVHVLGTFAGATITIQGSNDNTNWLTLNDSLGSPLTFTATGMKLILENPIWVRAISSGGAGTAATVIIAGAGGQ